MNMILMNIVNFIAKSGKRFLMKKKLKQLKIYFIKLVFVLMKKLKLRIYNDENKYQCCIAQSFACFPAQTNWNQPMAT